AIDSLFTRTGSTLRPQISSHGCPDIAQLQMEAGNTSSGICTMTLSEAEIFSQHGFNDFLIASQVISSGKIIRAGELAQHAKVTLIVDDLGNVEELSKFAAERHFNLDILLEISDSLETSGVASGEPAVNLAKKIADAKGLHFRGLLQKELPLESKNEMPGRASFLKQLNRTLETSELIEKAGLVVEAMSVESDYHFDEAIACSRVTEVIMGAYVLTNRAIVENDVQQAAYVLATVTSKPEQQLAILDCGQKAIGADHGSPKLQSQRGTISSLSAEHGKLLLHEEEGGHVDLGDKVWLIPSDVGSCANLYNSVQVAKNGKLEAVWNIASRGRYY
ncbi:hypothetical protein FIM02_02985, partial [SAR202 cluster bacterium AD-802-E10_MRT_200m]|nr:hypothetical protein [SAR202 cluster bacterium AD-802-E10_MRT_200m]